ncbi:mitochondrial enolase superfamily member 1 [Grus japonensis]|uniref:Mitochondrial enolase superfamily member 1 n=1 Tax=Grus japonensis TaxID=30415 RepID=A0ABC9WGZ9_GRUJA
MDIPKSMGPDRLHPQVLRELADIIERPLSFNFERLWQVGEVPEDWMRANVPSIFKKGKKKDQGNYKLVNLTSIPGKVMDILLGTISKHMKNKVIGGSQRGFMKGKSRLINLIAFYNEVTGLVDSEVG